MSRLLICGFGPFPQAPDNPAALAVERLSAQGWSPPGAQAGYAVLPTVWAKAARTALSAAQGLGADAVLLVGVAVGAAAFRVETRARNRASPDQADAEGQLWPSPLIDPDGADHYEVPAPVEAMAGAIAALGLAVTLSDDAGAYLCNFTLYRMLAEGRRTAFVHAPAVSADVSLDDIVGAVRAAARAFAAELE